jgi:hypothetical protein
MILWTIITYWYNTLTKEFGIFQKLLLPAVAWQQRRHNMADILRLPPFSFHKMMVF